MLALESRFYICLVNITSDWPSYEYDVCFFCGGVRYLVYPNFSYKCSLQEIVSIYPMLSPPTLTAGASNRVCNALALLQVNYLVFISMLVLTWSTTRHIWDDLSICYILMKVRVSYLICDCVIELKVVITLNCFWYLWVDAVCCFSSRHSGSFLEWYAHSVLPICIVLYIIPL